MNVLLKRNISENTSKRVIFGTNSLRKKDYLKSIYNENKDNYSFLKKI